MDETKNTDMVVKITGNQWYWNYEYPDEKIGFDSYIIDEADLAPGQPRLLSVDNPMVVPEGTRIKLLITGNDVCIPSLCRHWLFRPILLLDGSMKCGLMCQWVQNPIMGNVIRFVV